MIWIAFSFITSFYSIFKGNFLTLNSDPETMERNSGIFWAMLQCSSLIGNTYVFFQFDGMTEIDSETRTTASIL